MKGERTMLKNYKITFQRDNGTMGNDTFTARNKSEAKKDFKECYRHGKYKIISIKPFEIFENNFIEGLD